MPFRFHCREAAGGKTVGCKYANPAARTHQTADRRFICYSPVRPLGIRTVLVLKNPEGPDAEARDGENGGRRRRRRASARPGGDSGGGDSGRGGEGGGAQAAFPEGPITTGEGGGDEADGSDTPKSEYDGMSI